MSTQLHPRIAKRMPCRVGVGDQHHNGLVLNISQGGLFVQTHAPMPAGEAVEVSLTPPEGGTPIPVQARVVWKRVVPHEFRTSAQGGVGLCIEQADESYFQHLADWMRIELAADADARLAAPDERADYHVRVLADGTQRSRRFGIVGVTPDAARAAALSAVGAGWRVIEVKPAAASAPDDGET